MLPLNSFIDYVNLVLKGVVINDVLKFKKKLLMLKIDELLFTPIFYSSLLERNWFEGKKFYLQNYATFVNVAYVMELEIETRAILHSLIPSIMLQSFLRINIGFLFQALESTDQKYLHIFGYSPLYSVIRERSATAYWGKKIQLHA